MIKVPLTLEKSQKKTAIKFPDYYTDIKLTNDGKPEPPQVESVTLHRVVLIYHMMNLNGSKILTHYPMTI